MNKSTPKIYRTTNWSSYNRALINRGNIAIWFDPATQWYAPSKGKQGRNQTYSVIGRVNLLNLAVEMWI
ncbi:transposase DDE domain protein [Acinetobacter baumannii 1295743]|uniref:Transposase DDE domain protein n=1 Tax=Acinetobacter baumannii (strain 1295743) TaxID=1310613 RepID=A0A009ILK1_ACIB9|nr:transposase DDE domain protein [Acinetobacter baumannii 1295743]